MNFFSPPPNRLLPHSPPNLLHPVWCMLRNLLSAPPRDLARDFKVGGPLAGRGAKLGCGVGENAAAADCATDSFQSLRPHHIPRSNPQPTPVSSKTALPGARSFFPFTEVPAAVAQHIIEPSLVETLHRTNTESHRFLHGTPQHPRALQKHNPRRPVDPSIPPVLGPL